MLNKCTFAGKLKNGVMNFSVKEIATASMVLFAVIDIVGNVPIIISLRKKVGHIQSGKATIVAAVILITFLFIGEEIQRSPNPAGQFQRIPGRLAGNQAGGPGH